MLRKAVHLLLALALCLNGIFAPVVMAQHGAMPVQSSSMSCHENAPAVEKADAGHAMHHGDIAGHEAPKPAPAEKPHPDCCKYGQCLCSCVAANVPAPPVTVPAAAPARLALPHVRDVAAFRHPVALRPPIA